MRIKCPHCDGKGFKELNSAVHMTCGWCMGQGELDLEIVPTEPQTNDDIDGKEPMRDWGVCKDCALKENCAEYKPYKRQCEDYERYKEVLTNEEWFCQLPTEEKAKVLFILIENIKNGESVYTAIEKAIKDKDVKLPPITEHLFFREWLKQPHTAKE